MKSGEAITAASIEDTGLHPVYGGNGLRGYSRRYTHEGAHVLIGRVGALCGNVHIASGRFWASEHALVASLRSGHSVEWFAALLQAMNLNQHSIGAAQPVLTVDRISNLWAPVPPLAEQRAIARFLHRQTSKINRLVEQKRKLVGLLREMRIALVSQTVIKGLDPDVQMKDSGVEWLGEIPAHWQVRRLKSLCSRHAQYGANVSAALYSPNVGVRFVRTTDIDDCGELRAGGVFLPSETVDDYMLADGDLLISRSGTVGRSFLHEARKHGPCAYAGYLVRFVLRRSHILPRYAFYFTRSRPFADFVQVMTISSTIDNVNGKRYSNAPFPLPPTGEQRAIVRHVDRLTAKIDALIANVTESIDLLNEYRTALVWSPE